MKNVKVLVICLVLPWYLTGCVFFESESSSVLELDRVAVQCLSLGAGIEAGWCTILVLADDEHNEKEFKVVRLDLPRDVLELLYGGEHGPCHTDMHLTLTEVSFSEDTNILIDYLIEGCESR